MILHFLGGVELKKTYLEIMAGALSGLAGAVAKRAVYRITVEKEVVIPKRKSPLNRKAIKTSLVLSEPLIRRRDYWGFSLGVLGGIGTYYLQKVRGKASGAAGSFTLGSLIDAIQRRQEKKTWSVRLVANGVYGLTTTYLNGKLEELLCPKDPLAKCFKEIELRAKKTKTIKIRRYLKGQLSLRKTG